jgi:hypothetical protein
MMFGCTTVHMQNMKVAVQLRRMPIVPRPLGSGAKVKGPTGVSCVVGEGDPSVMGVAGAAKANPTTGANSSSTEGCDIAVHSRVEEAGRSCAGYKVGWISSGFHLSTLESSC